MSNRPAPKKNSNLVWVQMLVLFVIPIVILTRFSGPEQLGKTGALLAALAFPVAFELYNLSKRRKPSLASLLAIGGIMVTGVIGLLELSESWLAARRAIPYLAVSGALLVSILIKRPLVNVLLPQVFDMDKILAVVRKKRLEAELEQGITRTGYLLCGFFVLLAIANYILTLVVMGGPAEFNQDYARLRVVSLVAVSVPMLIGITAIVYYLIHMIERLTGLDFEDILKKK